MNQAVLNIIVKATDAAVGTIKSIGGSLDDVASKAAAFGRQANNVGRSLTRDLTLPIVAIGAAAFKTSGDFQTSMSQIVGLVGISRDQVNAWAGDLLRLGPQLGKSPNELAKGLYFITSAGIDSSKALDALVQSAKASAAGLGETGVVADAVTSAMNAYSSTNMTAAKATDILTAAIKYGKFEAAELAPVIGTLLPTASAMGVSFEQVSGILAVMSRTGLDASTSVTSLNAILSTLLKPSKMAKDALEEAGLSMQQLRDMAAKPNGLLDVMRLLDERFGDNDEALTAIVPNVRAFRGVMNVLAQDSGSVDEVMQGVANSTGLTNDAFNAVAGDGAFKAQQTMAQMKATLIVIGNTVMPAIERALASLSNTLKGVADWFSKLSPSGQKWVITIGAILAALGPFLIFIGKVSQGIGAMIKVFQVLGKMSLLQGGLIGGIILLAVLAVLIITHWDTVKKWFNTFWQFMLGVWRGILDVAKTVWNTIYAVISAVIGAIWAVINPFVTIITVVFKVWFAVVKYELEVLRGIFILVFGFIWNNVISPVINAIKAAFNAVWPVVVAVFTSIKNFIAAVFGWVWSNAIAPAVNAIKGAFNGVWGVVKDIFGKISNFVGSVAKGFASAFSSAFDSVKSAIKSAINWVIDKVNGVIGAINKTAGRLPGVPDIPKVPRLAQGGIVAARAGGTAAILGEAGQDEAVIPLKSPQAGAMLAAAARSSGSRIGGDINITNHNYFNRDTDPLAFARMQAFELSRR